MKGKLGRFIKRNSSTILTFAGVIGIVSTAVLAIKATPSAMELVDKAEKEKGEELTNAEKILAGGKAYIPTVIVGTSTIACVLGANVLNKKSQASIASSYALVDTMFKQYREKSKELYGEDADEKIMDAIIADDINNYIYPYNGFEDESRDADKVLFYIQPHQQMPGLYFETSLLLVQNAEYHLNRNFALRGFASVNEFYEFLGLDSQEDGYDLGWSMEGGFSWIDFGHIKKVRNDGVEYYRVYSLFEPELLDLL